MRCLAVIALWFVAFVTTTSAAEPQSGQPSAWLKQLAGEWKTEAEVIVPGQKSITAKGTESARMLGQNWLIVEGKAELGGMPFSSLQTLGYDPQAKKYVGTWVDSLSSYMWKYEGTLDESGRMLTLTTRGPCPQKNGELANVREVLEIVDKDQKTFTSYVEMAPGKWEKMVTVEAVRAK